MAEVVRFRSAAARAERERLEAAAARLIDELGAEAGHRVGWLARFADVDHAERRRLIALADEIERRQGFGWWFADDERQAAAPGP